MTIAILGWGSLLWDTRAEFDSTHAAWELDGPRLPLEFSRVSQTRGGVLTLVIDTQAGTECSVAYALSTRKSADDAIADLRCREGTTLANIGYCFVDGSRRQARTTKTAEAIAAWAADKKIATAVWTDLASNFEAKSAFKLPFSVPNAIAHLKTLTPDVKAAAAQYVWRAPSFVDTPLRRALQIEPWFQTID